MMKGYLRRDTEGDSGLVPFFVMLGAMVVVIVAFVGLNQFILVKEELPEDNGIYLDQQEIHFGDPYAILEIENYGTIKIRLREDKAPEAVNNFRKLCNEGFYNGLTFHRVISGFMIQGGDPNGDGTGGPGYTIPPETDNGLTHERGAVAMAKRSGETRMSGSQFYICHQAANHLDGEHTVFGSVVEGMDVVDGIAEVQTDANDRPLDPVVIQKAYIVYE